MLRLGILLTVGVLGLSAWSAAGDAMGFAETPVVAVASPHRAADAPLISSMSASGIGAEGPAAAPPSAVRAPAPSKRTSADAATAGPGDGPSSRAPGAEAGTSATPGDAPTHAAISGVPPPTATHAVVAASAGTRPAIAEPMHLWRGLRVPDGACGAIVGGRAQVLPCNDPRVKAYRAALARAVAGRRRDGALDFAAGATAAVLLGAVAVARRRGPRRRP